MIGIKLILTNLTSTYYIIYSRCYGDDANALGTAFNKNVTAVCEIFSHINRDYTTCFKGWIDGSKEGFNLTQQKQLLPYD
ncbi:MAG: hypothetical protein WA323_06465 [Candidatus Nitrosopolaris sp.]